MGSSEQQLEQLRVIFRQFDLDGDGSLTQLELAALLRSIGLRPGGDELHSLMSGMDSNGNGSVELEELAGVIIPHDGEEVFVERERLVEMFGRFDRDGNGYITAAELAGSMARMGHRLTFRELAETMREADSDGDGVISFAEFSAVIARSAALALSVSS